MIFIRICRRSAAAEIYAPSIALAEFLHITYVHEEMSFGKIRPVNILADISTAIAFAKCATKCSMLRRVDCRQRWVQAPRDRTICDLVKVRTDDNLSDISQRFWDQISLSLGEII